MGDPGGRWVVSRYRHGFSTCYLNSQLPTSQRPFLVASGAVAPVLSEGPIQALPDTGGRLVCNVVLGEGHLTS